MKLSILLATDDFRGDHGADVRIAIDHVPGETLEQLVDRIPKLARHSKIEPADVIEIRVVREPEQDTPL